MKGAILVSTNQDLYTVARRALKAVWPSLVHTEFTAQIRLAGGGLFNLYASAEPQWDWLPDMVGVVEEGEPLFGCAIECRSEWMVAEAAAVIATAVGNQAWLVDGDGKVWPASGVDASKVRL